MEYLKNINDEYFRKQFIEKKFDIAKERDGFQPIECSLFWWITRNPIGSKLFDDVLLPHELHLAENYFVKKVTVNTKYNKNHDIDIKSVHVLHEFIVEWQNKENYQDPDDIKKKMKNIIKFPQQYDFSHWPGQRVKYYQNYNYTSPVTGNASRKFKSDLKSPKNVHAVLCPIEDKNQDKPKILELLQEFINLRLQSIRERWKKTNQLQINCYGSGGRISTHYDSDSWFENVIFFKLLSNSGISFGVKKNIIEIVNEYLFHPMPRGTFIEMNQWCFDWMKHGLNAWMKKENISVTVLLRYVFRLATLHKYIFKPYPTKMKMIYE